MFSEILFFIYIINIKIYVFLKQHVAYNVNNTHIPPSKNVIIQHNDVFIFAIYMKKHNTNNTQFPHPKISSFNTTTFSLLQCTWKILVICLQAYLSKIGLIWAFKPPDEMQNCHSFRMYPVNKLLDKWLKSYGHFTE